MLDLNQEKVLRDSQGAVEHVHKLFGFMPRGSGFGHFCAEHGGKPLSNLVATCDLLPFFRLLGAAMS